MNRNGPHGCGGFTLAEVLVAMALLGLVLIMMFSALHTTSRSWYLGEARAVQNDERRLVQSFLRRQFEQVVPLLQFDSPPLRLQRLDDS